MNYANAQAVSHFNKVLSGAQKSGGRISVENDRPKWFGRNDRLKKMSKSARRIAIKNIHSA